MDEQFKKGIEKFASENIKDESKREKFVKIAVKTKEDLDNLIKYANGLKDKQANPLRVTDEDRAEGRDFIDRERQRDLERAQVAHNIREDISPIMDRLGPAMRALDLVGQAAQAPDSSRAVERRDIDPSEEWLQEFPLAERQLMSLLDSPLSVDSDVRWGGFPHPRDLATRMTDHYSEMAGLQPRLYAPAELRPFEYARELGPRREYRR